MSLELSKRIKNKLKKRLVSATAVVAVLALVLTCAFENIYRQDANIATVENQELSAKNNIEVIKDSTGINLRVTGSDSSSVNSMDVYQDTTKIQSFSYGDNEKSKIENFKITIPFGETHQITVMVNGETVAQKNIQNMRYISSAQDMVNFRELVNNGKTFEGEYVELLNNIDMKSVCSSTVGSWTPIGLNSAKSFRGTFQRKLLSDTESIRKSYCRI